MAINKGKKIPRDLPDVQNGTPKHRINIDRVGVSDLSYPIVVLDRDNKEQHTVADVTMSVELPSHWRGTHMSRFVAILNRFRGRITYEQIEKILREMLDEFEARSAHITFRFPYFVDKKAPVSGENSFMEFIASFDGEMDQNGFRFWLGLKVPVTLLCPCSREISEVGAHNQRAIVDIRVLCDGFVWIEDLGKIAESEASAPVFSLLKREDEKYITEKAFKNPRFVEDIVRGIAKKLARRKTIAEYSVEAISFESIHNHQAFARISSKKTYPKK